MINIKTFKIFKNNILIYSIGFVVICLSFYYLSEGNTQSNIESFDSSTDENINDQSNQEIITENQHVSTTVNDENNFIKNQIAGGLFANKLKYKDQGSTGSNLDYVPFMQSISLPSSFVDSLEKSREQNIESDNLSAYYHEEQAGEGIDSNEVLFDNINNQQQKLYDKTKENNKITTSDTSNVPGSSAGGMHIPGYSFNEPHVPGWLAILRPIIRAITKAFMSAFGSITDIIGGLNRIFSLFDQVFELFRKIFDFFNVVVSVFKYLGSVFAWVGEFLIFLVTWLINFPGCFLWYMLQVFGWILYNPIGFLVWLFPYYLTQPHDLFFYTIIPDIDCAVFDLVGFHLFHYSYDVLNRCYPDYPAFPKWNFNFDGLSF